VLPSVDQGRCAGFRRLKRGPGDDRGSDPPITQGRHPDHLQGNQEGAAAVHGGGNVEVCRTATREGFDVSLVAVSGSGALSVMQGVAVLSLTFNLLVDFPWCSSW